MINKSVAALVAGAALITVGMGVAVLVPVTPSAGPTPVTITRGTPPWNTIRSGAPLAVAVLAAHVPATTPAAVPVRTASPAPISTPPVATRSTTASAATRSRPASRPTTQTSGRGGSAQTYTATMPSVSIVYTTLPPDGRCGEGGKPGIQYICTGTYQAPPPVSPAPTGNPCAGTADQCLDALNPGSADDMTNLFPEG